MMEILTLEEAIDAYKAEAEQKRLDAALLYDARHFEESKDCIWKAKENEQLVKWLRKLQAYEEAFSEIKHLTIAWEEGVGIQKCVEIIKKRLEEVKT
jgi:hypothetical protein